MVRNILIEGVDCGGKSTLAKELKNRLNWDAAALTHKPGWQFERYLSAYATQPQTIFERGHVSEQVYSEVFNRDSPFSPTERGVLDGIVAETMLVILAIPDSDLARKRYGERNGVLQVIAAEQLSDTNSRFAAYSGRYPNTIIYQSKDWDELERLVARVQRILSLAPSR